MRTDGPTSRKRPVNLTLNEALVAQAKVYTNNLSATMEELLAQYVAAQQKINADRRQLADACAEEWNEFGSDHGSFADEYCTL
jgi:antitoxin CcdA